MKKIVILLLVVCSFLIAKEREKERFIMSVTLEYKNVTLEEAAEIEKNLNKLVPDSVKIEIDIKKTKTLTICDPYYKFYDWEGIPNFQDSLVIVQLVEYL